MTFEHGSCRVKTHGHDKYLVERPFRLHTHIQLHLTECSNWTTKVIDNKFVKKILRHEVVNMHYTLLDDNTKTAYSIQ